MSWVFCCVHSFALNFRLRATLWLSIATMIAGASVTCLSTWLEREYLLLSLNPTDPAPERRWVEKASKYDLLHVLELTLFDARVIQAARSAPPLAPQLGIIVSQDSTVEKLRLGYPLGKDNKVGLLFPRKIYGRVLRELTAQGVKAVALDVMLQDARPDHPNEIIIGPEPGVTNSVRSDEFFARQVAANGHVILASVPESPPTPRFRNVAYALGEVDSPRDVDGTARRIQAFVDCHFFSAFLVNYATAKLGLTIEAGPTNTIRLADPATDESVLLPIDAEGNVTLTYSGATLTVPAYENRRVWHMGIVLAAADLGLDLERAEIRTNQIILRGTNGVVRTIPTDTSHTLPVDWSVSTVALSASRVELMEQVLREDVDRQANPAADRPAPWKDKLVVIGSRATGSNLADLGATPLAPKDFLFGTYLNVANSILQNRFVHRWPFAAELAIQVLFSLGGALLTWRLRTSIAALCVAVIALGYATFAFWAYINSRLWLPIVHPVVGGLLLNHAVMLTWRVVFEQKEQQRVRSVFSKIVSPDVVRELLKAERVGLGGARRQLTVFFADVRGFTELTDQFQAAAEEHARSQKLSEAEAEAFFERQAGEVLATVNLYLATIADVVKFHNGTLDKYIGDCVMAFWGAPTSDPKHAVNCVIAAIDAQRAIQRLNEERGRENARREADNQVRLAAGQPPLPLLAQLALGTGINTGTMTVGLMGSDAHILNYTVFGREVNLASRLEGVSGRSRIIIGQETLEELTKFAPELAALCIALEPVTVKGFRQPVNAYEVPWRESEGAASRLSHFRSGPATA